MGFDIVKTFVVHSSPENVWSLLTDPERVARCLPGAAITGKLDDHTWQGTMTVKVGPVSSSYKGKVAFEKLDSASRTAQIVATGQDVRGRGGADLRLTSSLVAKAPGETEITTSSHVNVTGILAQMGRGMVQDVGDSAKVLSGGQSLLPLLKLRLGNAEHLVDIGRVPGLEYVREDGGFLRIGGRTRESVLERSDLIRERYPILLDTARVIADPLVRNRATVGGNLAHGDPANDHPATMLALRAEVVAQGPKGERVIPIDQFFTGLFVTALAPDEILTEIRIPTPANRSGGAYLKLERKVGDYATAAAAAQVTLDASGGFDKVGLALTNAGPVPTRAAAAESVLTGRKASESSIAEAARKAAEAASPSADRRGSVEYKREMARVLATRALKLAVERAGGR